MHLQMRVKARDGWFGVGGGCGGDEWLGAQLSFNFLMAYEYETGLMPCLIFEKKGYVPCLIF